MNSGQTDDFLDWLSQERHDYLMDKEILLSEGALVEKLVETLHIVFSIDEEARLARFADLIVHERLIIYKAGLRAGVQLAKTIL